MQKNFYLALLISILTNAAFSGTVGAIPQSTDLSWMSSLSAGPVWEQAGNTQTFYLTPEIEKTYVGNQTSNILANAELFVGLQKRVSSTLYTQMGFSLGATSNASVSGFIWDDIEEPFANNSYSYKIQHTQLSVKSKVFLDQNTWLMPWISANLGIGFNTSFSYQNTPLIYEAIENPNFASHTQIAFSYNLGAGVQKLINHHWLIGIGYEFSDWGKSNLDRAEEQTLNTGPGINHLYTNGILLNLTYLFS